MRAEPLEELNEVYQEVREMESNFKKLLDVCGNSLYAKYLGFMVEKNKELFTDNHNLEKETNKSIQKQQMLEDSFPVIQEENKP
jgi:hypothetical protein